MSRLTRLRFLVLAAAAFATAGCSDTATRPPDGGAIIDTIGTPGTPDTNDIARPRLIECPTTQTATSSGLITVLGGVVSAAGSSISIPVGGLLTATLIRVTVPASTYMEIDITANDLVSFLFQRSATVTIDYSRCPTSATAGKTLTVWQINAQTKALLVNMRGVNDPARRRMTFTTDHLSGYAIAQ
ncbi:MAG: hypothetical protein ACT4PJ_13975 [Gemmatimonadaceae bacterium]